MRDRPPRAPLVPRWLIIAAIAAAVVVVLASMGAIALSRGDRVVVPAVAGMNQPDAVTTLQRAGLTMIDGGSRFSTDVPRGAAISQEPSAGATVSRGDSVTVIFSAGTEAFPMPDVIGRDVTQATRDLELRGLVVTTQTVESQLASGTIVESFPSPGVEISTGAAVRLSVAGTSPGASGLTPYRLDAVTVVLDPVPRDVTPDVTLEVARRLRALVEASGGVCLVTRSTASTATTAADRAARAAEATAATCAIVLDTASTGSGGAVVTVAPDSADSSATAALSAALGEALSATGSPVQPPSTARDAVLAAVKAPGLRLVLGNSKDKNDLGRFADPQWCDQMARAVYKAIGATFASKR